MKLLLLGLLVSGLAQASTLIPLQQPLDIPQTYVPTRACVGTSFGASDSVSGHCTTYISSPCSGRGCVPGRTISVWNTGWNIGGTVTSDTYCGKYFHHYPVADVWTYAPGFDATTCNIPQLGSTHVDIFINGLGYWMLYITTSPDGAYELLQYGSAAYVNQF